MCSFGPLAGCLSALKQMKGYLRQMKSDLHKTFSIFQDWSPKLINNVCESLHTTWAMGHTTISQPGGNS